MDVATCSKLYGYDYVCTRCAGTAGYKIEIGVKMTEIVLEMSLVSRLQRLSRTTTHGESGSVYRVRVARKLPGVCCRDSSVAGQDGLPRYTMRGFDSSTASRDVD